MPETMLDKIWHSHVVSQEEGHPAVLYVDTHLVHEVTSPQAFDQLRQRSLKVRCPERTFATIDHAIPTRPLPLAWWPADAAHQVETLRRNCAEFGIQLLEGERQGIVHVIGPELGLTRPGTTLVCGDSHTSTHGAFGCLAFGIGTSEVGHVLATQCLLQQKPRSCAVNLEGAPGPGVTAKDIILGLIAQEGIGAGSGHVFEYRGSAIAALSMEARMTICNMSIEGGARAGMIAPDEVTRAWLQGPYRAVHSDPGAEHDKELTLNVSALAPMVTWGTNPSQAIPVTGQVPQPRDRADAAALEYMDLSPGQPIEGQPIDVVFIGSCTNGRLEDLREAASVIRGRRVNPAVRALVVPGSQRVKAQAEAEGLDRIFQEAGFQWRTAGCSMCLAMNDDKAERGQYVASTSNRNFQGRQGAGARTLLMSPRMAAAAALSGRVVDAREGL